MPTATIKFDSDFLVTALKRYRQQYGGRSLSLAIKVLALSILVPLAVFSFWRGSLEGGLLFVILSLFLAFAHQIEYWRALQTFKKSPYRDEDVTIELTEAGFHGRSPKQGTRLQWSGFTKAVHFKDGFLLLQGPKLFNWIPLSSLGGDSEVRELEALLHSKISNHRIVEPIGGWREAP